MSKKHPNPSRVKIHRIYTVEDVARLYGIHKNTVRAWITAGLPVLNGKRPLLILGHVLKEFLYTRRKKNKRPCNPGQFYCLRCRAPRYPAENMADYTPVNEKFGNLVAYCPDCDTIMNQRVSLAEINLIPDKIEINLPEALKRLNNL